MIRALAILLLLAAVPCLGIPLELQTNLSLAMPAGFEAIPAADDTDLSTQIFAMRGSNTDLPPTYFSVKKLPAGSTNSPPLWQEQSDEIKLVGHYSERLYNLDLDILDSEIQTNDNTLHKRSVQIPLRQDLFLLDLTVPAPKTNEMDMIMKQVVKTLAEQNAAHPEQEVQGSLSAIFYLLMVAAVILVVIARR